jgi:integrase/recombinase XerD
MFLEDLFEKFLKEKTFLTGVSPKTVRSYRQAFNCYVRLGGAAPTKESLKDFVIKMRESGLSAGACNVYIRSINSFLTWLNENGHCEALKIKQLPQEKKIIPVFSEKHLQALIRFRPKDQYEWRLHTLIMVLVDTGARIDEVLTCLVSNVDLDNLIVKVRGKGNKERLLPISVEMRKSFGSISRGIDLRFLRITFSRLGHGAKLEYHNTLRGLKELCGRLGIEGVRLSPHSLRRYYAVNFIRRGGDLYRLSRILGHTSVSTQIYLRSMGVEMVQEIHQQLSPLSVK